MASEMRVADGVARRYLVIMTSVNDLHSWTVSILRLGRGLFARQGATKAFPEKLIEIYEFEACPFCRKVRETLSELDIDYVCRTSARGSSNRAQLVARGGKAAFPYLVDPNTGSEMYESEDIISYLHSTYGHGRSGFWHAVSPLNTIGASIASVVRPVGGFAKVARAEQPAKLLEVYGFEASPYVRKVREAMNALDLDYISRNVAKQGSRRAQLVEHGGQMMVPYLIDPNADVAMYESDDIVRYLHETYGTA